MLSDYELVPCQFANTKVDVHQNRVLRPFVSRIFFNVP